MGYFTEVVLREALHTVCKQWGLPCRDAELLHHYNNAVFALPAAGVVARLTTSARIGRTIEQTREAVSRLVGAHGFLATAPLMQYPPVRLPQGVIASLWRYYRQPSCPRPFRATDPPELLRALHDIPDLGVKLPLWEPLASLRGELARDEPLHGLDPAEAAWLRNAVASMVSELAQQQWPLGLGLIHGDAWAGNLLWGSDQQAILGDWDNVSIGPREIDLIPTWHAAVRYGRDWTPEFVATYGYNLADNAAFDVLLRMRDFVQLTGPLKRAANSTQHMAVLRQRFEAIRSGDRTQTWTAL